MFGENLKKCVTTPIDDSLDHPWTYLTFEFLRHYRFILLTKIVG